MAKHKRKQAKPISRHRLFPVVVALWFGALFGLGGLVVRASLIESLVLSAQLDLVVPAAAPPLGTTARIMVALLMAVVGAAIGAVLARRLTRVKVEPEKHDNSARGNTKTPARNRSADQDALTCKPISMRDLDEEIALEAAANAPASRRRALTSNHDEDRSAPYDLVPLPGDEPQIQEFTPPAPAPAPASAPNPAQSKPVAMPIPESLSLTDLTLRLAESMRRRRTAVPGVSAFYEPSLEQTSFADASAEMPPRGAFSRIEDPEPRLPDSEAVVIFPGQGLFNPSTPTAHDAKAAHRLDSPFFAESDQPLDSGESDRALRTALANLQRMNGTT